MNDYDHFQRLTAKVRYPVWPRLLWAGLLRKDLLCSLIPSSQIYLSLIQIQRARHSTVWMFANLCLRSSLAVLCTCSMHGEKQQILPKVLRARFACTKAAQGFGTSKNNASAFTYSPQTAKPLLTTSRQVEVTLVRPRSLKNCLVIYARCWLNSNVQRWPCLIVSEKAQESDPDPVPAQTTMLPGTMLSLSRMAELSIAYKIWVFLANVQVIRVDFGLRARRQAPGLLKAYILVAQGQLMKLRWRQAAPSDVWILFPAISCCSFGASSFSKSMPQALSFTRYS